jgi:hypothetical protein
VLPTSAPLPTPTPAPDPPSVRGERPLRGWVADYDRFVEAEVRQHMSLLQLPGARMAGLCNRWDDLSETQRTQFYSTLLRAVASAESDWDRRTMFNETGIIDPTTHNQAIDSITGFPVISEGLLQLSYQDMRAYAGACKFDFDADKAGFKADLQESAGAKSFKSQHPERSILDPYVSLGCGLTILDRLAGKHSDKSAQVAWGKYWSTLRQGTNGFTRVSDRLRERSDVCR